MSTTQVILCMSTIMCAFGMGFSGYRSVTQAHFITYEGYNPYRINYLKLLSFLLFILICLLFTLIYNIGHAK